MEAHVPEWLGRLANANKRVEELEAENKRLTKQRDRAEKKYDSACLMMANARGPDGWEVVEAGDGQLSLAPTDWRGRAEKAEADSRKFVWILEQFILTTHVLSAVPSYTYFEEQWNEREDV